MSLKFQIHKFIKRFSNASMLSDHSLGTPSGKCLPLPTGSYDSDISVRFSGSVFQLMMTEHYMSNLNQQLSFEVEIWQTGNYRDQNFQTLTYDPIV